MLSFNNELIYLSVCVCVRKREKYPREFSFFEVIKLIRETMTFNNSRVSSVICPCAQSSRSKRCPPPLSPSLAPFTPYPLSHSPQTTSFNIIPDFNLLHNFHLIFILIHNNYLPLIFFVPLLFFLSALIPRMIIVCISIIYAR